MVVLDAALHILQLVQNCKHVDELAEGQEVGLGDKVLPPLRVAQPLHLAAEALDGLALWAGPSEDAAREGGGGSLCSLGGQGPSCPGVSGPRHLQKGKPSGRSSSGESLHPKVISGEARTLPHRPGELNP